MRVAVIGAGLAGLACAVDLARAGVDVTVFEARDRVGGRAWSERMPDGARFERGGEFIEAGYDQFRRRAAEYDLPLVPQGFAFAAREVRSDGRSLPALLPEAEETLATVVRATRAGGRGAPRRPRCSSALRSSRSPGWRCCDGSRAPTPWSSTASRPPGSRAPSCVRAKSVDEERVRPPRGRQRRAGSRSGRGTRRAPPPGCPVGPPGQAGDAVEIAAAGVDERYERAVLAVPLPQALALVPALGERPAYARLVWGVASKLHVPLATPAAPAAVQGLEAAFWTWTAAGAETPSRPPSRVAAGPTERSSFALGPERWRSALGALRPELLTDRRRRADALGRAGAHRRRVRLSPARMVATGRRRGRRTARPHPPRRRAHGRRILRHARGCPAQRRTRRGRGPRGTCADCDCALTNVGSAI